MEKSLLSDPPAKQTQTKPICRGVARPWRGEAGTNPISNAETAQCCEKSHPTEFIYAGMDSRLRGNDKGGGGAGGGVLGRMLQEESKKIGFGAYIVLKAVCRLRYLCD